MASFNMDSGNIQNCMEHFNSLNASSLKTDHVNDEELLRLVNAEICKCMKDYIAPRKITEAKYDTFDCFFSRLAEEGIQRRLPYFPATYETVGSRGEGLGFLANDTDILSTQSTTSVFFPSPELELLETMFVIDISDCHPGYCKLKFHRENKSDANVLSPYFFEKRKRGMFLCNDALIRQFQEMNTDFRSWLPHGPALTSEDMAQDLVIAMRCVNPDNLLNEYMSRTRTWPEQLIMERLTNVQYAVVNVSHPNSLEPRLEFRISFASAEKLLLRSLTDVQFACYAFLKNIKRQISVDTGVDEDVLKTYFVKMAFLWTCEKLNPGIWSERHFLHCASLCLAYLQYCFHSRNLPQLFIPNNNLIDHMAREDCHNIAVALDKYLHPMNPKIFLRCLCDETLEYGFDMVLARPRRDLPEQIHSLFLKTANSNIALDHIASIMEVDTLSYVLAELVVKDDHVFCQVLYDTILLLENIVALDMVHCLRSLLYRLLGDIVHRQPRFVRSNNTQAEELYKRGLRIIYPVSHFDDEGFSGNTKLAMFHYLNGDYKKALEVLYQTERLLYDINPTQVLSIIFVHDDLPRTWRDPFLTKMIEDFGDRYLHNLPVKCNAVAFYIFARSFAEIYTGDNLCTQRRRIKQLKRSVLKNMKHLDCFDDETHVYTRMILDRTETIIVDMLARM